MHIDIVDIVYLFCWIYAIVTWWLFLRILSVISRVNPPTAGVVTYILSGMSHQVICFFLFLRYLECLGICRKL